MSLIFCVLVIAGIIGIYIYYDSRKKQLLPRQIEAVKELIDHLNKTKIQIHFCEYDPDEGISCIADPLMLNLFGLAKFNSELINEKYEDEIVLFNPDSNQLFEVEIFINDKFLPKIIVDELLNFKSKHFKIMEFNEDNEQPKRFVNVQTGLWTDAILIDNKELIQSDMEALESWQSLIDCAEQLEFVIVQWLKDAEVNDNGTNFDIVNN